MLRTLAIELTLTSSPCSRIYHIAFRYISICSDSAVPTYSCSSAVFERTLFFVLASLYLLFLLVVLSAFSNSTTIIQDTLIVIKFISKYVSAGSHIMSALVLTDIAMD